MNHIAGEYEDGLQRCVVCGAVLVDDRGAAYCGDGPPPKGFAPGPVYAIGNMTAAGRDEALPDCTP